ncbi:MaoC/PaaZ C-terminal domain-containing protein [Bradyrhizobium sp. SSUT18]|uniref:MaoC family dehydratase n=1 Tax=unclassified Bradyrhizobium TaxID=2631580 RepID=UPI00244BD088|nr:MULTISPECIES: MaoC/PaaZ C-terminal domain-containing protein [unclassified Bradyrhizobium]MDH2341894.1 MaoC/PaaZ C-terminal domain-containing protein [Bradyrhizobium sp. SSUT77]MDH2354443.1 MaoC/PaaZ C-terminal domain-containing protein [Bradyrhizobium sp. SSUT112]MDH2398692.1 MaoC/PaaZ C-terminal domain-containing protein [Bradyrhizobium sp. SSUT18]
MDTAAASINLRYEDIALGAEFETAAHTVTEADIGAFADVTRDHHPLHVDTAYARARGFPAVIGHGLFGLSLMEGLKSELKLYEETSVASLGWDEVRFTAPIVAGDSLRVRFRFVEKRPTRNPDRGIVIETLDLVNQRDEVVTAARHTSLILTRQGARDPTAAT